MQGPWNQPKFFLDMAGILDNPDAAYAQLRQLGQGLFGSNFLQSSGATGNTPGGNNAGGGNIINGIGSLIQGLTGKPNATPPAGQSPSPQQPAQGQAQSGTTNPGQATNPQAQSNPNGAPAQQQASGPAPGQPATGGGLGQILGPQQKNQLDQIMQNLFGSGGSAPSK